MSSISSLIVPTDWKDGGASTDEVCARSIAVGIRNAKIRTRTSLESQIIIDLRKGCGKALPRRWINSRTGCTREQSLSPRRLLSGDRRPAARLALSALRDG